MLTDSKLLGRWLLAILTLFVNNAQSQGDVIPGVGDTVIVIPAKAGIVDDALPVIPAEAGIFRYEAGDASMRWHDITLRIIAQDYKNYYSHPQLPLTGLAIGGITANAEFDFLFRDHWQNKIRSHTTNEIADFIDNYSHLTHWYYSVPVYTLSLFAPNPAIQQWGNLSLRMLAIGMPQQALLTSLLGSSRPAQGKPQWHPFQYHRGVSGHAFYGAVPLLALAAIQEQPYLKWSCYTLSILPGLARINNDKHYFTQAFLGWWLAYSAFHTVSPAKTAFYFAPHANGIFLAGTIHF